MEERLHTASEFQPELFCLRCQSIEWDETEHRCANFEGPNCPLSIKSLLAGLEMSCLVV